MNKSNDHELDPRLLAILDELKPVPARDPGAAARARAQFLAEAVSRRHQQRHSLWTIFQQKEQFAMKLAMSMLVIVGLLFGGNATVSAAQDDLPNEPLYQIKLMSEDVRLWLASDPAAQIELLMNQAQARTQEMAALVEAGVIPPAELRLRAEERIQRALQLAADLDEPLCTATLQRIQMKLQTQEQLMDQLQDGSCSECEPVLQQTREMLRDQLREVESHLGPQEAAPSQNQNQNQYQNQIRITQTPPVIEQPAMLQGSRTPVQDGTGQQNGAGNPSAGTPMPQNNTSNQDGGGMQNGPGDGGDSHKDEDSGHGDEGDHHDGHDGGGHGGRP